MSDDARPPTITAQPPFDNVDADIILHTSDNVDFRVFRLILALSSPFFQDMFTLPQPSGALASANDDSASAHNEHSRLGNGVASTPLSVDVAEDSLTLDTLLCFLYPNTHTPSFHNFLHARNVALAASKYDMSIALDKIAYKIQMQYVVSHPLRVYFIACWMGWEGVAKVAAKFCLDSSKTREGDKSDDNDIVQSGVLDYPGAAVAYHRLEEYRGVCHEVLQNRLGNVGIFRSYAPDDCSENEEKGVSWHCLALWIIQYLSNVLLALANCPKREVSDDRSVVPQAECSRCSVGAAPALPKALLGLASDVDDIISQVELRFGS